MKIGIFVAFVSPLATPELILNFGRRTEEVGLDSIWMGEHVLLFDRMEFPYPGSKNGRVPVPEDGGILEMVATFGFLAAATKRIRLGSGICLVPQRNPVYTAKEFATLDWLTGGRIDFGIGVGWCKEEVIACGYRWEDRGERCDEILELMQAVWTQPVASLNGKHVSLAECRMDPKPVQKPHVPIFVGGHSAAAMRRAARFWRGMVRLCARSRCCASSTGTSGCRACRSESKARRGFSDCDHTALPGDGGYGPRLCGAGRRSPDRATGQPAPG
ncbi:MAG TPA: TIGR03619 family F420-dependent LLM class oxidoreductase [Rhizomicrobium sp.]|nr:TIGR03619 family F420-dependent LLM class oxidoreductase [Rhizomicrobium sp.]